jgi:hypothetical protein
MKDGRTHLAHKAEQAVDLETGAVLAVTLEGAGAGDTATLAETVMEAAEQLARVATNQQANKIRRHLAKARQRRGFGWKRWSREWLYGTLGLFHRYRLSDYRLSPAAAPA